MAREERKELIGIIVISHCDLASELVRVAELIVGTLPNCKTICFDMHQPVEEMTKQLKGAIKEVDQGKGVLILTDLFGGTPANISLAFVGPRVEVICGVNLPMLIRLAGLREADSLAEVASIIKEYGKRHISLASEVLARSGQNQSHS
ncbi:PTS sugar transporter subunit IIA [Desulfoferrobacter suflitae]|uniref:PTS sugar transporter subunit IIA n=1 Tax=Desulfoferrobacter suflitae TaxID=2865782 RepID=UPI00216405BC|nr:PTS sugar transporter subunit IIA [Desulfoferrobacter suflitae]MCK8600163.1 PTS sugar transporter subunit IIA [Desulfoferrobacter suflitae]